MTEGSTPSPDIMKTIITTIIILVLIATGCTTAKKDQTIRCLDATARTYCGQENCTLIQTYDMSGYFTIEIFDRNNGPRHERKYFTRQEMINCGYVDKLAGWVVN